MLHGRLLHRSLIALAALAALALASPWAAPAPADAAQVTVVSPGGSAQTLALAALAGGEDVSSRSYTLRSDAGDAAQAVTGFSLAAILEAAGADPYGFSYLEVQRPAGGAVVLSGAQALDAGSFADGPPAIYATAAGTGFLRPSAGPRDLNAGDCFEAPQGLTIVLRKGTPLRVRATASTRRTRPGRAVDFSAIVARSGAGEQLTYSWYFDDGDSATGPDASHSFAKHGSYDVVVGVTSAGDDVGASAVVTIQVGAPLGGPDRRGGGRNPDATAPDHGTAEGPVTDAARPPAGRLSSRSGRAATDTQRRRGLRVRRDMTAPAAAEAAPETPAGELVEGELVSAGGVEMASAEQQVPARSGQLQGSGGGGVPGVAWGVLGTISLLGLGALAEAGGIAGLRLPRGRAA
jgi:hypothetical protein